MTPLNVHVQAGTAAARTRAPRRLLAAARKGVRATLAELNVRDAEISVTLLADPDIAKLNREWLRHSGPTDVLSFPLYKEGEPPTGDVYIGIEQAARQAEALGVPLEEEVTRLAIHGTLHVLGYDHPEGRGRVRSAMWRLQERILARVMDP